MKSDRLKAVFVHIPKCGGSSVEEMLFSKEERTEDNFWMGFERSGLTQSMRNRYQTGGLQHLTALQLRHAMGREAFASYYRFGVVRHPVKRSLSQYKYTLQSKNLRKWIGMSASDPFEVYLKKTYKRHHVQWQDQVSFLYDHRGNCLVNDVIRLEKIDTAIGVVFDALGIDKVPVPHVKKSKTGHDRTKSVSENAQDILWELYKDDFEVLDYDPATY